MSASQIREREAALAQRYPRSRALLARAENLIPGGFHLSGRPLVDRETTPAYFESGSGARIVDVDGHEYIDYLMAFGSHLLGYAQKEVLAAAFEQAARGALLSLNHPLHLQLVESLLPALPGAELAAFFKTGSEATTAALRIARAHTGRRVVVRAGYHGWHDWCLPLEPWVPAGLAEQVLEFNPNDPDSLQRLLRERKQDVAAVILAPEMVLPFDASIFHELARLTREAGALFVLDEVKTGLRIAPGTISDRIVLVPDLITVSKALANGFPLALVAGSRKIMGSAAGMHYSATFHGDTMAMAACLKTQQIAQRDGTLPHIEALGQQLIDGLNAICNELRVPAHAFGEPLPAMPYLKLDAADPRSPALSKLFYREVLARGVLLHPRHMWFISGAHTARDIRTTLDVCQEALRVSLDLLQNE